jgi:hypothetical protein
MTAIVRGTCVYFQGQSSPQPKGSERVIFDVHTDKSVCSVVFACGIVKQDIPENTLRNDDLWFVTDRLADDRKIYQLLKYAGRKLSHQIESKETRYSTTPSSIQTQKHTLALVEQSIATLWVNGHDCRLKE